MNTNYKLKFLRFIFLYIFVLLSFDLSAEQNKENIKSLDMIVGDDYLPSESRFGYEFLCAGDNRVILLEGLNYTADDGGPSIKILRIQSNASQVKIADLNAINSRIYNSGGVKMISAQLKCNRNQIKLELLVRQRANGKLSDGVVEVVVSNDAIIKIDEYKIKSVGP